ncbi:DNA recombination protein RmuC [Geomonas sp. Red69]|uniref:DNA recombination protein RmuC n=1 Tax=Geomonas diazotrophica TaxID=2843197 RepID=A0ABX8JQS7_9BACT|nr:MULTISPECIES: DNA recombination protein RmuC [Geomonas]MBU5635181.1 DNA recombination protein RmuC [Geomonas diazotrophica]QWV97770.1 DNA recombination protein RmuC [Geomonas nitrogeniifigens]QXE86910.1 DNA recombination protein RmuC [Geomonas nitrogeniifigens]
MSADVLQLIALLLLAATLAVTLLCYLGLKRLSSSEARFDQLEKGLERLERTLQDELRRNREELGGNLRQFGEAVQKRMVDIASLQKGQMDGFTQQLANLTASNEQRLDKLRETVEVRLKWLQEDNSKKLEQMRATVDEKLHETLEKRLGESFKQVSGQLEQVHKGLGEMQSLASGVGDLKKVLSNIKTRGTLGEVQLHNLLEQILTPDQYGANVATKPGSDARVEFAVRLPGRDDKPLWLPIDAKFPQEDFLRLVEAQEQGNQAAVADATRQFDKTVQGMAKLICDKYLAPPETTDFAVMFLANEASYAQVLSRPGLFDTILREHKVIVAGPTTIAALLSSLSLGFRTLAIEKRSSDVWRLLGAIKTEFMTFGTLLDKTRKKLDEASSSIDTAATRTRRIQRKMQGIEELPEHEAKGILGVELPAGPDIEPGEVVLLDEA